MSPKASAVKCNKKPRLPYSQLSRCLELRPGRRLLRIVFGALPLKFPPAEIGGTDSPIQVARQKREPLFGGR